MNIIFISVRNFFIYLKDFRELFLTRLIRLTIYGGAFLLPLFYTPLNGQFLEYSKVVLFYFLLLLGIILWLIKVFITKKLHLQLQFLDIPIILFILIYLLASLFSLDRYQSFFGLNLFASTAFITIFCLALFYFLVSRFVKSIKEVMIVFYCLIAAVFTLLLNSILNLLSVNFWPSLLGNSVNTFYFLFLLGLVLCGALFLLTKGRKNKIIPLILSILLLLVLYVISNQNILLLLILAIFLFIVISSFRSQYFSSKLVVALTFLLFVTVLILILPVNKWLGLVSPVELSLPSSFGWQITKASLADNFLLGVGPQNFAYSFYKYKPLAYNQTNFWQLGFAKNSNWWLEIINNIGLLGILIFLIILSKYFYKLFIFVRKFEVAEQAALARFFQAVISSTILAVIVIYGFLANFDFLLLYLFFLFLALGASLIQPFSSNKIFTNKYAIDLLVYIFLIIILCFSYFGVKIVLADIYANLALAKNYTAIEDFNWGEQKMHQAIKNNPSRLDYYLNMSNLLINKLLFLQKSNEPAKTEILLKQILDNLNLAAKNESPRVDQYLSLQQNYAALKNLGLQVIDAQQGVNEKLIILDPNNPELYIDRALLNFEQYLLLKQGKLEAADKTNRMMSLLEQVKADLEKSLALKNNYVLGYFNLGLYYQELGDQEQTLINIEKAYNLDPSQKLVVLSLKKLYLNQDKADKAIEVLTKYLDLNPKDTEGRLELVLVYRDNNKLYLAKEELNKILEIEPENESAKEILEQLK